mmetsp:Transcript_12481/g.18133  ORF Transcript_12481/g.18133 Transcript_12481/m.18133 type:complete len:115 (-) Transcript_12481:4-348(-)
MMTPATHRIGTAHPDYGRNGWAARTNSFAGRDVFSPNTVALKYSDISEGSALPVGHQFLISVISDFSPPPWTDNHKKKLKACLCCHHILLFEKDDVWRHFRVSVSDSVELNSRK